MSVELIREGKVSLRFNIADVSINRVSMAFQVEPSTIFLKEEFGDLCYWPNESGRFNLQEQIGSCLQVMGEPISEQSHSTPSSIPPASASALSYAPLTSKPGPSGLNPVAPKSMWGKKATFSCKVVFATMQRNAKGVAQFAEVKQSYITLDEQSANITEVTAKAKFKFGEDVVLVAGNGLPIEDEPGTRGSSFWKCGSRKLYAIPRNKKRQVISNDDSDEDFAPKKRYSGKGKSPATGDIKEELASLMTKTNEIKEQIAEIVTVSKGLKVPLSVIKLIRDTFKCKICHSAPMIPPIIASRCCNTLLACNKCINTWYAGDDGLEKSCPNCREARGYAHTVHFKGLDDFMVAMTRILDDNDCNESE